MNNKTLWHVGGIFVLMSALALGLAVFIENNQSLRETPSEEATQQGAVTLSIDGLYSEKEVHLLSMQTPLDVLRSLNESDPDLSLVTKEYSGLGTLVEGMAGKTNGTDNKYWQYTVNGVMPQVGADTLQLTDGDSVAWRFQVSEF